MRKRAAVYWTMLIAWSALLPAALATGLGAHETKLVGRGLFGNPSLGSSVAISADGTTAIAGAPYDNGVGSAVVFIRTGNIWSQQGPKLTGTGGAGTTDFGRSVALSADGNTAIVGAPTDNAAIGAAWVFTRSGGVWSQQGNKLVGTGGAGPSGQSQGTGVALSADGNTAIVGGPDDNSGVGASWVFMRNAGTWSQQGNKLVGTLVAGDGLPPINQGQSVALSADGNTALIGGPFFNSSTGAVWVFTRSGSVWSQQGARLVGTGGTTARQGRDVALSADGNTALVGGLLDNANVGAAWVFTRSGTTWSQQGSKLVGTGAIGAASQGSSVSISGDGNLAIVGGRGDNAGAGAVWLFARNAGVWSQQGQKIVGSLALSDANQGFAVRMSTDGNTAISGGPDDNGAGAAWVLSSPPCSLDVDGNNSIDAMTDGLLIVRAMLGMTGSAVTQGALAGNASRSTWAQLQTYLNGNCGSDFAP